MQLNCKVIKKWQPPISTSTPPIQGYSHFVAKILEPLKVTQFLTLLKGGGRQGGVGWGQEGVQLCFIFLITMYNKYVYTKHIQLLCREFPKATKKNMFMRDKQQYHYRFLLLVEPLCCLLLTAGARK